MRKLTTSHGWMSRSSSVLTGPGVRRSSCSTSARSTTESSNTAPIYTGNTRTTPKQLQDLTEHLADIRNSFNRISLQMDHLIDYLDDLNGMEIQTNKAARNREDAIDELLRKEGLWW